ncbi:Protein CANDIDATE G-PROTEIN COUPLED REPTOR 7 [Lathyrus oleraceus]|uniref:Protein CANDIDATE G-PROTEIN COUPLED REPTOR 7 n=1 Tax=Pisum sativum TaxID=3888 RepID=A0A9D4YES9_PEA|nr:Protein CANDIDATE G-PROTEIN COUPLED REPTOR 7 [Pisum sativum]
MPQPPTFKPLHPSPTFHLLCDNHTILPPGTTASTPPRDLFTHETPLLHITQLKTLHSNKLRRVNISVRLYPQTFVTSPPSTTIPPLLFFANCAPQTSVSMVVRTEIFNLESDGSKDYLSAGQTQLPSIIHLLMAVLLLMKALNLICAAEDKHYVKVTGLPHGWDVLFYIFQFIRVVVLFTVIVLIGTGWSFLKPFLQDREKKVSMIVIPLQVLANLASVVIGETGPFIKD